MREIAPPFPPLVAKLFVKFEEEIKSWESMEIMAPPIWAELFEKIQKVRLLFWEFSK